MAKKEIKGPIKPGYNIKRVYIVDADRLGTDVFESSRGAARFIANNVGSGYISHINAASAGFTGQQKMKKDLMKAGKAEPSGVIITGEQIRDNKKAVISVLSKMIRDNREISFQVDHLPVMVMTWKAGEYKPDKITTLMEVKQADFFKGRQYPSYVDQEGAEQEREINRLDDEAYRKARLLQSRPYNLDTDLSFAARGKNQTSVTRFLKDYTGIDEPVYFDDADLVVGSTTVLYEALIPDNKNTMQDAIDAINMKDSEVLPNDLVCENCGKPKKAGDEFCRSCMAKMYIT